jgi:hypothetical protein
MRRGLTRIQKLARRVGWLDRHRRVLAIAVSLVISPIMIGEISEALGSDWPQFHSTMLSIMIGLVVWCIAEVCLAGLTAIWETEYSRLIRDRGLPRAQIHKS